MKTNLVYLTFCIKTSTYQIETMFYRIKIVCLKEKIVKVLKRNNKKVLNAIFKVPIILVRKKTLMKTKPKRLIQ